MGIRLHTPSRICSILNDDRGANPYVAELVEREDAAIVKADLLMSPTRSLLEWVEREVPAVRRQPRFVVRYPFDASSVIDLGVSPEQIDAVRPVADVPVILCFGRLERRKGIHLFVEAAIRLLREGVRAHFRVIGGDTNTAPRLSSMRNWLIAQIPEPFRPLLTIEEARPRRELGPIIQSAQACVFPALWDNFPNALLEAMSLRACCVGADSGGIGEVIEHERNGLLFPAGDVDALTDALRRAIGDPDFCAHLGAAAPDRVSALCAPHAIVAQVESLVSAGLVEKASSERMPRGR